MDYWRNPTQRRLSRRSALALSAGAAFLAACGGGSGNSQQEQATGLITKVTDTAKQAKRGGVYLGSRTGDIDHSDPHVTTQQAPGTAMTYSRLFRRKPGYLMPQPVEFVGDLAESFEQSADKLTMTVKLRNSKWHPVAPVNARAVDAQDVAYTWSRVSTISANRSLLANSISPTAPIESIRALDDRTVQIKTAFPSPALIPLLSGQISGYLWMLPRESEKGYDVRKTTIGSGPWYVSDYSPSVKITFKRNEGWYDAAKVNIDQIDQPIVPEYATGLAQYKTGAIYGAIGFGGTMTVRAEDVLQVKSDTPQLDLYLQEPGQQSNLAFFGWNPAHGAASPFRDKRMRQALSMAVDRDLWIDTFYNVEKFKAAGVPMESKWNTAITTVWPGWWADPRGKDLGDAAKNYQYNLAEAKKLIAAAGYTGSEIKAQYPLTGYTGEYVKQTETIMGFARAAGLNMVTAPVVFGTDWRPKIADAKGDFEGISFRPDAAANLPDPIEFMFAMYHPSGGVNYTGFNSADSSFQKGDTRLNDLLNKARSDFDDKNRIAAVLQLQKTVADEMYIMRFPGAANAFVMSWPAVRNVEVYTGDLMGINEWIDPTKAPIAKS